MEKGPSFFQETYDKAYAAGMAALKEACPVPMTVYEADLDGSPAPGGKSWYVSEGCCGFAWVKFYPGNSKLANFLKKKGYASPAYGGGVQVWVREGGQSMTRKEAFAEAFAQVFEDAGFEKVYAGSRMD